MDGLLDIEEGEDRCTYETAPYIRCIRSAPHQGDHFFILPESFFELTEKGKK